MMEPFCILIVVVMQIYRYEKLLKEHTHTHASVHIKLVKSE